MAAVDYFLKIDNVQGESQDDKHKGEIELMSFSWGASNSAAAGPPGPAGGGAGAGKVAFQDLHFSTPVNLSSPVLMLACASGQHFQKAVLTCRKAGGSAGDGTTGGVEFSKFTFTDVLISGFAEGSHQLDSGFSNLPPGDSEIPTDEVSFTYQKIEWTYTSPLSGQVSSAGWDVKANKKV